MTAEADTIAATVLEAFRELPAKRKPAVRDNGLREWVPLSGIVVKGPGLLECVALATGMKCLPASKIPQANGVALHDWHAEVLTLRALNRFLLDECRRLVEDSAAQSPFLRRRTAEELATAVEDSCWNRQPFAWRDDLTLHMYCSEAPCGDASMELIMSAQDDATPWTIPSTPLSPSPAPPAATSNPRTPTPTSIPNATTPIPTLQLPLATNPPTINPNPEAASPPAPLLGRGYFSHLGIVRRKPSRPDAPPSLSKSCSDKLALRQCTSVLSSLTSLLVAPGIIRGSSRGGGVVGGGMEGGMYLSTLVLPRSQFDAGACRRCFSSSSAELGPDEGGRMEGQGEADGEGEGGKTVAGTTTPDTKATAGRMAPVRDKTWPGSGYGFYPFRVEVTDSEFEYSRRALVAAAADGDGAAKIKVAASNLAIAWTRTGEVDEGLICGVLQGRKAFDVKGASLTSRRRMWATAADVAAALGDDEISQELAQNRYDDIKDGRLLTARRRVKEEVRGLALKGWHRNTGDGGFSL